MKPNFAFRHLFAGLCLPLAFFIACAHALPARAAVELQEGMVMVMPFQVNGTDDERLADELPVLIGQRLRAKGLTVMPYEEVLRHIEASSLQELDLGSVRRLLELTGAGSAIYGSYLQAGEAITIDARLVMAEAAEGSSPIRVSRDDRNSLLFAVEELAGRVNSELRKDAVIAGVEVRGTKTLDPEVVLLRINTRRGDTIDAFTLDRELKHIWDLGYFSDIVLELEQTPQGTILVFNVIEKPRISRIDIENADAIDPADIRAVMALQPGEVLNDKVLATDLAAIKELYNKKGHYLATAAYRLEENPGDNTAALVLSINEGEQLYIQDIIIKGAEAFSQRTLKKQLALSERWIFSIVTGSGVLQEELLERDSSALRAFYMDNGFIDVSVLPAKVDYTTDGITITHQVVEGPRYTVDKVAFTGELIDSDAELLKLTEMSALADKKAWFSMTVMQMDTDAIRDYYSQYGYAYAAVNPQPRKSDDPGNHGLLVVYNIEKQQKVYVRNIVIEGNTQTRDNVILREMRLADGDPFNGNALKRSMQRLNNLGYFELAESELTPTDNPEEADLKVRLRDKSTGSIMGGVGYSTYSKFGISGSIQENNLWGKGYNLGLQVLFSDLRNSYDISFTNPRVNDSKFTMGIDLYRWEDDYIDFDRHTFGAAPRIGYPLGEYSYIMGGYRLDFYELFNFDDDVSQVLRQYEGNRIASVASIRLGRDTTDRMRPADGTATRFIAEYGGGVLGGDDSFVKLTGEYNFYKTITTNSVFHFKIRGSTLFENDNEHKLPVFERFWMGGMDSVRGYLSRDIVPRDPDYGDRIGGDRMAFANLEYIWHISPEIGLNLVPFFDMGVNYNTDYAFSWHDENKKSAGLELRWRSPMGDLRFSWGYPFDKSWTGSKLSPRFEFSIGNFF